jgi:hypothetical protein
VLVVLEPFEQPLGFPVHPGATLQKLVGEQVHEQPVVPAAVGGALVAAQDADRLEAELRVRPDRALVVGGGVDRQAMVAALLDQVGDDEPQRLGAEPLALVRGAEA